MHVTTTSSHGVDKALPCCHGGTPEAAERVILCLRQRSQQSRHSTVNSRVLNALLHGEIHPVVLRFLTPPTLALGVEAQSLTCCTELSAIWLPST